MSTNNVVKITDCLLDEQTLATFEKMGDSYMMYKRFLVGKMPDMEKFKKIVRINSILQNSECLLDTDFDKIKQQLVTLTH